MISGPAGESAEETALSGEMPKGCKVIAIDDSVMLCKAYERIVLPKLGADMARSKVIRPFSQKCVDDFVVDALGVVTDGSLDASAHADVVILDQNIEFVESGINKVVFGTNLATKLRSCGFTGLVIVRSASLEVCDKTDYHQNGAVDLCLRKLGSKHSGSVQTQRKAKEVKVNLFFAKLLSNVNKKYMACGFVALHLYHVHQFYKKKKVRPWTPAFTTHTGPPRCFYCYHMCICLWVMYGWFIFAGTSTDHGRSKTAYGLCM
jgi:hypothetical protein